ncbi:MAG: alpha/beta hydrolase, partial [Abiotrophia defectiva]|nr:alpha/beta hydrolase [Abiotrophia defectiva]
EYSVRAHAQYLSEFVEDLKLNQVIVFGHSLGGAVAIELCNLIGKRVKKLILTESNLDPSSDGAASFDIASLDEANLEREFAKRLVYYQQAGYTTWLATLRNWLPKAAFEISRNAVQGGQASWRQLLYQFDFPKYFIFGEQTLPDPDFEKLQEQGVKIEVVPKAGHSMAWENPEGLAQAIRKCL